jgi:PAS domain S-box-containing protein
MECAGYNDRRFHTRSRYVTVPGPDADPALRMYFAGILDVAEDGIITIDEMQRIVLFNRGAEKVFGWPREKVLGKPIEALLPPRYSAEHRGHVEEFARSGVVSRNMGDRREVHGRRKSGEEFPAEVSISKMQVDGRMYFTAIVRDVSARRRAEDAIRQLNQELEGRVEARTAELVEANRQLTRKSEELVRALEDHRATTQQLWQAAKLAGVGEMAASIAHELNNPLGIVALRLEAVLAKTPADDLRRRALEIIEQELDRMAGLVSNLLQFSRPGREEVSSVDLGEEAARTLDLMHHHLKKRSIAVVPRFGPEPVRVHADRQKLRQVFLNLVSNAADAMPQGGTLTLTVRRGPLEAGAPGALIEVADTGHGIPPEVLPKVMDAFFTTKEEGKGTGLGLAICRRIVQEHHGTIQIDSAVGTGTKVSIAIPVGDPANVNRLRSAD